MGARRDAPQPRIQAAIILAAGMGRRLRHPNHHGPKGLLEVGGMTLIERSLRTLRACGVLQVVLVVGYRADAYRRLLSVGFPDVEVRLNPDYARTGSMRSLYAALGSVADDFLLLESDLLYESRAVTELLLAPEGDWLLLSGATGQGDEVYAYGATGRLVALSKKRRSDLEPQGEFVGISRLTPALLDGMCRRYRSCAATRPAYQYDDCLSDLSAAHHLRLRLVDDLVWAEIDDAAQLRRAVEYVYPEVLHRATSQWPSHVESC